MNCLGELIDNKIIVNKSRDIGRLYNKSHLGKLISHEKLVLNFIEASYLLNESKIKIIYNKKELDFSDIVKIASQQIENFEIKFLVFRDLRNRGYPIKYSEKLEFIDFYKFKPKKDNNENKQSFITSFSERDLFNFERTNNLVRTIEKKKGALWYAIVDEEGDITYYDISSFLINGKVKEGKYSKINGFILKNRILVFEKESIKKLQSEEFYGKPFGNGLQLSLVEALYLVKKGILNILQPNGERILRNQILKLFKDLQPDIELRFLVFKDLKKRGFIIKTGFKYGTHFRVYTEKIGKGHADYLIHVIDDDYIGTWADMSRGVRLAHSVNKEFVFAKIVKKTVNYIELGRLRP